MNLRMKELEILGSWTSDDKNPYKVVCKIVQRDDKEEPEILFVKEFYSKGKLFSTTKLGRINSSLASFITNCIKSYKEYLSEIEV